MSLWQMSLSSAVLILVIVFVRALLLHKLPKKTFLALWTVVLLRLLVPFSFSSSLSVYTLAEKYTPIMDMTNRLQEYLSPQSGPESVPQDASDAAASRNTPQNSTDAAASSRNTTQNSSDAAASSRNTPQSSSDATVSSRNTTQSSSDAAASSRNIPQSSSDAAVSSRNTTEKLPDAATSPQSSSQNKDASARNVPADTSGRLSVWAARVPLLPSIWTILWAAGFTLCLGYFLFSYVKCYRNFQMSLPAGHEALRKWYAVHPLRRKMSIRQSDRIISPLSYGILHPVILMPKTTDWSDTRQLWYILEHEYIHIQRFDVLTKLVMAAALCIHWFNPFVWVMYLLFNRDIELSCDETVIRRFGENTRSAYAMTLISMEEKKSGLSPLYNSFSKNAIEERILAIMKIKKITFISCTLAVMLVAGITAAFATSASAPDRADSKNAIGQTDTGYNMDEITARMTELNLLIDEKEKELDFLLSELDSSVISEDVNTLSREIEEAKEEQYTLTSMLDDLETQQFFNTTYGAYGIHYELPENRLYIDQKIIQYFYDEENGKALWADNEGEIYVEVIRNSNGEILRLNQVNPISECEAFEADDTPQSSNTAESFDLSFQAARHGIAHSVSESERFYEYEKFGLSYDDVTGYLMYDGKTVGYFKDEYQPGAYTRFTDEGGELGVVVVRNESGEIAALQVDPISECEAFDADEGSDAVQYADGGSAGTINQTNSSDASGTDSRETTSALGTSSETNDSPSSVPSVPSEYAAFGISVNEKTNFWTYHGKGIAAIYDNNGGIYTTDSVPENNAVYLEVERDSNDTVTRLKEITKEEMQKLFDQTQFDEVMPGEVAIEE